MMKSSRSILLLPMVNIKHPVARFERCGGEVQHWGLLGVR
jgi:hypothetical protein